MNIKRCKLLFFFILCSFILCGCGKSAGGVKIKDLSLYTLEYEADPKNGYMNLEFENTSKNKSIDLLELSFEGNFLVQESSQEEGKVENTTVKYRILDQEGIEPRSAYESTDVSIPGLMDGENYRISISKVRFTDGSSWNAEKASSFNVKVNGNKGKGMPISLEELNYYEKSQDAIVRFINVLWRNNGDKPIKGLTYEISCLGSNGEILKDSEGSPKVIYLDTAKKYSYYPGTINDEYSLNFMRSLTDVPIISVRIIKAVAEDGTVYDGSNANALRATFLGKKEYAFGNAKNTEIAKVEKSIRRSLKSLGKSVSAPLIYIREGDFAVIRYDDLDIRIELKDSGKIDPLMASFVSYIPYSEYKEKVENNDFFDDERDMSIALFTNILTQLSAEELKQKITEFYQNYSTYIDLNDRSYDTLQETSVIKNENGDQVICRINGLGRYFDYYPVNDLFWAYDSPYESERGKTVPKRP